MTLIRCSPGSPYDERKGDDPARHMVSGSWMDQLSMWQAVHGRPSSPYGEWVVTVSARSDFFWRFGRLGSVEDHSISNAYNVSDLSLNMDEVEAFMRLSLWSFGWGWGASGLSR
ncbi:hypothetical protein F2Q70_00011837 [Brassica cretica]|uniref:Uncharacterized protein n=1 Tax=Brassica cretica TaxID=69181 RepID=A0A3N6QVC7_BRACR|nr:hypothetical protein F2Q70_00011837 [Brassica cretica]KAF3549991.1 hypothetical protein DY000_02007322 [Brassica cretica]